MAGYSDFIRKNLHRLPQAEPFLPLDNPTFGNPAFEDADFRVLIVRLSPFRDVDRSLPHLFLFHEVRQALPEAYIDLAFFPTAAQREMFERESIPFLLGTQSLRSADAFDLILISNAYTLELINLPYLLIHSSIPLFASQRGPEWPIILLGGSNAMATQAIVRKDGGSLVDGIFFGEGEGLVGELASLQVSKFARGQVSKEEALKQMAQEIPGLWIAGALHEIVKTTCEPDAHFLPAAYPTLNTPEAHTAHLQITHGCPAFCSFCFEGYDRKPYRELPLPDILAAAQQIKQAQGVEEASLYSFNFSTHSDILSLLLELNHLFDRVTLSSQRVDILQHTPTLLDAEVAADKREFTLGIEGISVRQRAFLHKSLSIEDITSLLVRLLRQPIRRIKLFYILTGYETDKDIAEFRDFVRWLRNARRASGKKPRVIFSAGLLIRMPFTPLRHDRLFLEEADWKQVVGPVKSACETNGFEFRMAFDWPAYCTNQVLALGGHWLMEPVVALAQKGHCFDTTLSPDYWDELQGWMHRNGYWNEDFLEEKGPDYPFALEFVRSNVTDDFLYRRYRKALPPSIPPAGGEEEEYPADGENGKSPAGGENGGYCLGTRESIGRCLGCGACADEKQRHAITHHQIHQPERSGYLAQLRQVMAHKRQLQPIYLRLRTKPWLGGVEPAFLNAFVFKELLARYPELTDNLLSARESLFTIKPNDRRFPGVCGESVFALKAWDLEVLQHALTDSREHAGRGFEIIGPAEGFVPGVLNRLHLDIHLPNEFFPEPRARLEEYLRGAYLPYSLRREGEKRLVFDLSKKALKKKILFGGSIEKQKDSFFASLDVGHKFDLAALLGAFPGEKLHHHAQVSISKIEW